MNVVAVVLHYRRESMTLACVRSLERSAQPLRVLVVDNDSNDGSGERLRAALPGHEILSSPTNLGYAGGNNLGISRALAMGATHVLVLNDDAEVDPQCVGELLAALQREPRAAAVCPLMTHAEPADRIWYAGAEYLPARVMGRHLAAGLREQDVTLPRDVVPTDVLCGCAMLIPADVLREHGAFRSEFWAYAEDLEWSLRLRRAGRLLLFNPRARLVHKVPFPEPEASGWKIALRDQNRRAIAALHLSPVERLRFWAFFLPSRTIRFVQYAVRGDGDRARGILRGLFGQRRPPG